MESLVSVSSQTDTSTDNTFITAVDEPVISFHFFSSIVGILRRNCLISVDFQSTNQSVQLKPYCHWRYVHNQIPCQSSTATSPESIIMSVRCMLQ